MDENLFYFVRSEVGLAKAVRTWALQMVKERQFKTVGEALRARGRHLQTVRNEFRDSGGEYNTLFGIYDSQSHTAKTDKFEGTVHDWVYTIDGDVVWAIVCEF